MMDSLGSFFHIPGVCEEGLSQVSSFHPETPSASLDTLPPIYRSVDGGLYYAKKQALIQKTAVKGEEFEFLDLSVLKLNLGHRLSSLKEVSDTFFSSPEERSFLQELVRAIVLDQRETIRDTIYALKDVDSDELSQLLSIPLYRGLTILHCCVLFISDDDSRFNIIERLIDLGAKDASDHLGATALMRAQQLMISVPKVLFDQSGMDSFFHTYRFYHSKNEVSTIDSVEKSKTLIQQTLGRPISEIYSENCESELVFYLYLFLPPHFSAQYYNQKFLKTFSETMPFSLRFDKPLAHLSVMPHGHSRLGDSHYGLFAEDALEAGRIVTVMNGFYQIAVKKDCDLKDQQYDPYTSEYGFYFLPLHDVSVDYYDVLLYPSINILPECNAHPIMFINDSGQSKTANMTWVYLFVNGLPMILFVNTVPICKGFECLTDYIQENPFWAKQRSIDSVEIPLVPHPFFSQ